MPRGFHTLIAAQFFSALADNALLIVAIALLHERGLPAWWAPLLKLSFTLAYVLLAPWVGVWADSVCKKSLMGWMNALKCVGAAGLLLGVHPLSCFAVVGAAAAAYAPAKYGLVTEIVGPGRLVAANGWIEVAAVGAVLIGTALGGALVAAGLSVGWVLSIYGLASLLNLGAPRSPRPIEPAPREPVRVALRAFGVALLSLWRDSLGGLSLAVTTLFWGAGATLQFALLRWAEVKLGLPLAQAAYLQAVVALGVVAGAAVAGRFVGLRRATRVLPLGVALGGVVMLASFAEQLHWALPLLIGSGALAGVLVVPMNALLQHRGLALMTPGRSIAVQNFNENASILVMLAVYAGLLAADVTIIWVMNLLGAAVALTTLRLIVRRRGQGARLRAARRVASPR